jgi:hypothetical protein
MLPIRAIPVIIIIGNDTNINMTAVNLIIKQLVNLLKEKSNELCGKCFSFAILSPSDGGKWITGKRIVDDFDFFLSEEEERQRREEIIQYKALPMLIRVNKMPPEEDNIFVWQDLSLSNECKLVDLFCIINEDLSSKKILGAPSVASYPSLILFYCGSPSYKYKNALELLRQNRWFQHSKKISIAFGVDTDRDVLGEFTENSDTIFDANDQELLLKIYNEIIRAEEIF